MTLEAELAARQHPEMHPADAAAIAAVEAERPNSLAELHCRIAVARAASNRGSALGHLRTARAFRAATPLGGNPGRRTAPMTPPYLEETDDE